MEKKIQKKKYIFILAIAIIYLLGISVHVQAAGNRISVKVNESEKAVLEKTKNSWQLTTGDEEKDKQILSSKVLYLRIPKKKELLTGYYTFNSRGVLDTRKTIHTLDTKIGDGRFKGKYYFGEKNGRLWMNKPGWTQIKKKQYYLSKTGRICVNRWVKGYYVKEDGQIAKNMQTPDGSYVDCDGHKCTKEEMSLSSLKKQLVSMISGYNGTWSVYVKDLKTGDVISINDTAMKPASVIKLFTMAATYDSIKHGKIKKDSAVNNLLTNMITVSDNESYNELVRRNSSYRSFTNGCNVINNYLKKAGCTKTGCHSSLHPSASSFSWDGQTNMASAKDAGLILEKIYKGKCVSAKYSNEMLNLLLHQTRRWKIPSGLPAGTKCANKTGENDSCQNDVAIVYGKKTTYIVCIFSQTYESSGVSGIRALSSKIYKALN
ncbi:serine hydrolase [Blautia wexlerae]|uniref:Serine hydrolase n=1 Tax=Blautia wexlerae TaxID=418240 RepID=A0ABX2GSG2_9FIRM|nr:serine hydrolase [Blautia wexlerae]NSF74558.1 serine hydrolase [Blautia wexlerae]